MRRFLLAIAALCALMIPGAALAEPADIAAAARGVVRVVIMGTDGQQVFPVSHGSGFAVAPNRIVTNAHVVRDAASDDTLRVAVIPSDGEGGEYARIVAISPDKDLALLEISGALRLPRLTLAGAAAGDGDEVVAVGYPMNVDKAQGLEIGDLFRSQPPVKSRGYVSGSRPSRDVDTILHTAPIARGNSGGPLLDSCGRVLGANSFATASEDGADAEFSFAVSGRELGAFLKANGVEPAVNALPCRSIAQLDAAERDRLNAEQSAARARLAERADVTRAQRERAQLEAEMDVMQERENAMALAALALLVAAGTGFAAVNFRSHADGGKRMCIAGVAAAAALIAALALWFTRPGIESIDRRVAEKLAESGNAGPASAEPARQIALICTIQPERSRIVGPPPQDVRLDWTADGCVNRRTQYGFADGRWTRLFVPASEDAVSINTYDPESRTLRSDRYPLSRSVMQQARDARARYTLPGCGTADAARRLGEMQSGVTALLPPQPTERLVYACRPTAAGR